MSAYCLRIFMGECVYECKDEFLCFWHCLPLQLSAVDPGLVSWCLSLSHSLFHVFPVPAVIMHAGSFIPCFLTSHDTKWITRVNSKTVKALSVEEACCIHVACLCWGVSKSCLNISFSCAALLLFFCCFFSFNKNGWQATAVMPYSSRQ